ncbi:hypothetical protein [Lewinella sp. JB7]|uniref:hypothetical protein n=1 Tax=Lewinella sp. JB7 TaxID=2962887 RepID=UPI0020C963A8|nr:hypothetical protein [Lewinella sp. JB7]MCP9236924.1 hypothetical protein [Lewinella sp. JB7]
MHEFSEPCSADYLIHCRACLGMCRHCLATTTPAEACHDTLPDLILALEVATILIEVDSDFAFDKVRFCVEACAFSATNWAHYDHPFTRQCSTVCREFVHYWHMPNPGVQSGTIRH